MPDSRPPRSATPPILPFSAYRFGDLTFASQLPLPELPPSDAAPDWTLRLTPDRARPPRHGWFHHWDSPRGRRWLSFGRDGGDYLLRFTRLVTFRLSPSARDIVCEGVTRVPARTVRHLLLNQVMPLGLGGGERIVVHASAVSSDSGAIAFAGAAGVGKSTLAAACAREGWPVVCDDALVVRSGSVVTVAPTYRAVRLWPEAAAAVFGSQTSARAPTVSHYTRKRLVALSGPASQNALPLRALCVLAPASRMRRATHVSARPLSKRDALIRLASFVFQLDVQDPEALRSTFARLATLVEHTPTIELAFPWRLTRWRETAIGVMHAVERL